MKKTLVDTLIKKINKGEIKMKSQFSVWTEKLGVNGGIFTLLALLILLIGFILYWINSNNDLLFGGYGKPGFYSFIQSFPYVLLAISIILFIVLTFFFRTFDFSYKKPFFLILIFVIMGILTMGWISSKQPISQRIYQQEGRIFRMGMMNNSNAVSGMVIEIKNDRILIENTDGKKTIINTNSDTHFPFGQPKVGDQIRSVGSWKGDVFIALGIRIFDETNPSTLGPGMMRGRGQGQGSGIKWNR